MPLVSFGVLIASCALWGVFSPTQILHNHPRMFYFAFGNVFSNITVFFFLVVIKYGLRQRAKQGEQ